MKVLVLGSGGREHALVWKLRQSPRMTKLYCAPGNGGIAADAECLAVDLKSIDSLVQLANRLNPDLTVVGPELPLTLGIVDEFQRRGWPIFGPTRAAAQLESSKSFAKEFMQRHRIPTAKYSVCSTNAQVREALKLFHAPIVVKADGLAAGKGVVIAQSKEEAQRTAEEMLAGKLLGEAGSRVVLEECLKGEELSFLVMSDGERVVPLVAAQDHKRAFDNDQGPNTGGMGAYSANHIVDTQMRDWLVTHIARPVDRGHARRRRRVQGHPLLRHHDDRERADGAGVQLPLRRSRDAAHHDAHGERSARCDGVVDRRPRQRWRFSLVARSGRLRGDGIGRISRRIRSRKADHRHRRSRSAARV